MNTSIVERITDFLKDFEPFNLLTHEDLKNIAANISVVTLEKHKVLFQVNDKLHSSFYVLASGAINLTVFSDAEEILLNKCYPGDIFGLRPFFAKNNYQMTAKAREDSIVYAIPIEVFKPFVAQNSKILDFLLESFATNTKNPSENKGKLLTDAIYSEQQSNEIQYFQSLNYNKTPLKVALSSPIKEVAQLMNDAIIDSAIIIDKNQPIGIVTDADFRSKVATGRISTSATIDKIMSSPVFSVPENISVAEAQLIMLMHNVTHLCVTQDGSEKSTVKGVISQKDLIVAQANNPGILIKEIKRALNSKELKDVRDKLTRLIHTSFEKNIPIQHVYSISGEITTALVKRAVELAILDLGSPPVRYAFFSIGSQGRKEQLLLTDQDHFLIFEDVSSDKYKDVKDYFLKLAKRATSTLEKIGYPPCPNGHIAENILWCKSVSDWIKQYNGWMKTPGEKSNQISSIFFDYELVAGESKIEEVLNETVFTNAKNNTLFFDFLGNDTLRKNPPLNFFKKFNVEEEGISKGKFDIKNKAILPLVDGARLFALNLGLKGFNNTYLRYKQLAIVDPKHSEIYLNCAEAFLVLSKIMTKEGLKYDNSGQFINLEEISKTDKELLKISLTPMKELEDLIKDRFQLTQFS